MRPSHDLSTRQKEPGSLTLQGRQLPKCPSSVLFLNLIYPRLPAGEYKHPLRCSKGGSSKTPVASSQLFTKHKTCAHLRKGLKASSSEKPGYFTGLIDPEPGGTWSEAQRLGSGGPAPNRNRAPRERPALRTPCRDPRPLHQERRLGEPGWGCGGGDVGEGARGVAGGREEVWGAGNRSLRGLPPSPGRYHFLTVPEPQGSEKVAYEQGRR